MVARATQTLIDHASTLGWRTPPSEPYWPPASEKSAWRQPKNQTADSRRAPTELDSFEVAHVNARPRHCPRTCAHNPGRRRSSTPAMGRALERLGNAGRSPMGERLSPLETAIQARRVRGSRFSRSRFKGSAFATTVAEGAWPAPTGLVTCPTRASRTSALVTGYFAVRALACPSVSCPPRARWSSGATRSGRRRGEQRFLQPRVIRPALRAVSANMPGERGRCDAESASDPPGTRRHRHGQLLSDRLRWSPQHGPTSRGRVRGLGTAGRPGRLDGRRGGWQSTRPRPCGRACAPRDRQLRDPFRRADGLRRQPARSASEATKPLRDLGRRGRARGREVEWLEDAVGTEQRAGHPIVA